MSKLSEHGKGLTEKAWARQACFGREYAGRSPHKPRTLAISGVAPEWFYDYCIFPVSEIAIGSWQREAAPLRFTELGTFIWPITRAKQSGL
jgi:hypothetical protein